MDNEDTRPLMFRRYTGIASAVHEVGPYWLAEVTIIPPQPEAQNAGIITNAILKIMAIADISQSMAP